MRVVRVEHQNRLVVQPELNELRSAYAWWCEPCSARWPGHHLLVHPEGFIPLPERHRVPEWCPRCGGRCSPEITWDADWNDIHLRWLPAIYPPLPLTPLGWVDLGQLETWQRRREVARLGLVADNDTRGLSAFDVAVAADDRRLVADLSLRFGDEGVELEQPPAWLTQGPTVA